MALGRTPQRVLYHHIFNSFAGGYIGICQMAELNIASTGALFFIAAAEAIAILLMALRKHHGVPDHSRRLQYRAVASHEDALAMLVQSLQAIQFANIAAASILQAGRQSQYPMDMSERELFEIVRAAAQMVAAQRNGQHSGASTQEEQHGRESTHTQPG